MLNNRNLAHYKESPVVIFEHLNWIFTFPTTHLEDLFTFSVMHMCRFNYCTFVMFLANLATGKDNLFLSQKEILNFAFFDTCTDIQ